jgi:hypothetical protein
MPGRLETAQMDSAPARRGVYLLTHPRSASNLFQTMMANQPGFQSSSYKVLDAAVSSLYQLDKGQLGETPEKERKALYDAFRAGFDDLQDELEDAQKNVSVWKLIHFVVRREEERSTSNRNLRCALVAHLQPCREMACFVALAVHATLNLLTLLACRETKFL